MGKLCLLLSLSELTLNYIGDLSPFDFFRQETSHQDVVVRTDAMKKVAIIAALMGPEKCRTELLQYLQSKFFSFIVLRFEYLFL
jgi:hypothetical protein